MFEALAYHRAAITAGELWRFATATLAHLSSGHLALNLLGLMIVVLLLRRRATPGAMALAFAVAALTTTLGIHFATQLDWYAGASAATLGLLAWGATRLRWPLALPAIGALLLGALLELDRTHTLLGEPLAAVAHLWGIAGGLGWALGNRLLSGKPRAHRPDGVVRY